MTLDPSYYSAQMIVQAAISISIRMEWIYICIRLTIHLNQYGSIHRHTFMLLNTTLPNLISPYGRLIVNKVYASLPTSGNIILIIHPLFLSLIPLTGTGCD